MTHSRGRILQAEGAEIALHECRVLHRYERTAPTNSRASRGRRRPRALVVRSWLRNSSGLSSGLLLGRKKRNSTPSTARTVPNCFITPFNLTVAISYQFKAVTLFLNSTPSLNRL
jgi:hypothetical protein